MKNSNNNHQEGISRRALLGLLTGSLISSSNAKVSNVLKSDLSRVSDLPDEVFNTADDILGRVKINPKKDTAIALLRKKDGRVFVIVIENKELEKQAGKGGAFNKGLLYIKVVKGGLIEDLKIEGDKEGELFRYGIIGYKDEDGISILDEKDDNNIYGKIKNVKPERRNFDPEVVVRQEPGVMRQELRGNLRIKPIQLGYKPVHREKRIEKGELPYKESLKGRIIRSYRWKSITDSVEDKYNIPRGLILAMMAQEGYGDPTLPNLSNDGGLGLIHIQAINAHHFGLKTLPRYTTRMRDSRHAAEVNYVKSKENNALHNMIRYDDRFHPILAVDVAARFLVEHYRRTKKRNPRMSEGELWNLALRGYSGRSHLGKGGYGGKVREFQSKINDSKFIGSIRKEFSSYDVVIDGKVAGFDEYIKHFSKMAENYELAKYRGARSA